MQRFYTHETYQKLFARINEKIIKITREPIIQNLQIPG